MKITGTFLDEITHDIPAQNWGPEEWARDFNAMKSVGIDTVILIRAGYKDRLTFPAQSISQKVKAREIVHRAGGTLRNNLLLRNIRLG